MPRRIVPFERVHADEAAAIFVGSFSKLRSRVQALPAHLENPAAVAALLAEMSGVVALEDDRLVGYLTSWFPIERFRDTDRTGAYVPEWAHGTIGARRGEIANALYRTASAAWAAAGCELHAITLLAGDAEALDTWFWSGFGMGTIDAVRPVRPLEVSAARSYRVRMATDDDRDALAGLDVEHTRHYTQPPVFMIPPEAYDADRWRMFMRQPRNSAWVAEDPDGAFGFIRFDREFDGAKVVETDDGVFITGAYVRASHRGRGAATAILDAALHHYAAEGLSSCAVDFEAFNPEAAAFWMRHFTPVCSSLIRVPESGPR
jgi:GNAT superfamily N-acetyltransferase